MAKKIKSPVGRYFKTRYSHYYCYGKDHQGLINSILVEEDSIDIINVFDMDGIPESTREEFMAAYARTIETIDGIVEGGK